MFPGSRARFLCLTGAWILFALVAALLVILIAHNIYIPVWSEVVVEATYHGDYALQTCVMLHRTFQRPCMLPMAWFTLWFGGWARASIGDRLPEFKSCVQDCITTNCHENSLSIPLHRTLLLWDCPSECDYACQHIITDERLARDPPYLEPVVQYHGKWPFHRFLGIQEPASVLFSFLNFVAHQDGITKLKEHVPESYRLRWYYLLFGYTGLAAWTFSMIFHTRDFDFTEKLDYFAAAANIMYGLYFAVIRICRLDQVERNNGATGSILRLWTCLCLAGYGMHVGYLSLIKFDYSYNMIANVVVGVLQNVLWTWFSIARFRKIGRLWAAWPSLIVAWIVLAMSLELFDFPPYWGMVDAHALWHLGTVIPTFWWYNFLIKDAQEDLQSARLKA